MGVAPMVAMGPLVDGSIFNFAYNMSNYLCTNFGAFIKKCTIDQLIRSTNINFALWKWTPKVREGREGRLTAETWGQRVRRGQRLENLTDVLYGWSLTQKYHLFTNETSTITFFTSIIIYIY